MAAQSPEIKREDLTTARHPGTSRNRYIANIRKHWMLYLMIIPGILYYIVFKYVPLAGSVIAFQDYQIFKGILGSPWVGLDNFGFIFSYQDFYNVLRNTAVIAFYQLVLVFRPRSCWLCCSMKSASCWRSGLCKACSISRTFIMGRCRRDRFRAVVQPRRCECGAGLVRLRTHSVHAGGAVFPRDCRPVLDLEGSWLGHDYLFGCHRRHQSEFI